MGRCLPTSAGTGTYSSSKCTTEGGKQAFAWSPGANAGHFTTKLASGAVTLETVGRVKLTCVGESGSGEWFGAKRAQAVTLRFSGCLEAGKQCASPGAAPGEVRSETLNGTLGVQTLGATHAKDKAALSLFPPGHHGAFAQISCGTTTIVLRGAGIVPVKANKAGTTQVLKLKAAKGKQKPEKFAGGAVEVLEASIDGAPYEQAGLTAALTQTDEEALEIDTVA